MIVAPFFVAKRSGALRLILDCRPGNRRVRESPCVRLGGPADVARLLHIRGDGDPHVAVGDVKGYFHCCGLPPGLSPYFFLSVTGVGLLQAGIRSVEGVVVLPGDKTFSQSRVVLMGWTWACYFAQSATTSLFTASQALGVTVFSRLVSALLVWSVLPTMSALITSACLARVSRRPIGSPVKFLTASRASVFTCTSVLLLAKGDGRRLLRLSTARAWTVQADGKGCGRPVDPRGRPGAARGRGGDELPGAVERPEPRARPSSASTPDSGVCHPETAPPGRPAGHGAGREHAAVGSPCRAEAAEGSEEGSSDWRRYSGSEGAEWRPDCAQGAHLSHPVRRGYSRRLDKFWEFGRSHGLSLANLIFFSTTRCAISPTCSSWTACR